MDKQKPPFEQYLDEMVWEIARQVEFERNDNPLDITDKSSTAELNGRKVLVGSSVGFSNQIPF
jgi:hypothetical protein